MCGLGCLRASRRGLAGEAAGHGSGPCARRVGGLFVGGNVSLTRVVCARARLRGSSLWCLRIGRFTRVCVCVWGGGVVRMWWGAVCVCGGGCMLRGPGSYGEVVDALDHSVEPPRRVAIKQIKNIFAVYETSKRIFREVRGCSARVRRPVNRTVIA